MPYYLVTQTSLMEGADEVEAARKVLTKLQSDGAVGFTVKYDEENIQHVTVANVPVSEVAQPAAREPRSSPEQMQEDNMVEASAVNQAHTGVSKPRRLSVRSVTLGLSLFAAGVAAGMVIMALVDRTPG
ncbi:hypothetical protein IFT59_20470 [Rhizobium sp. CFBP 8752]|uniref:hypothetical protein n=1 Tax=Rhizobium sp. CFBP 8752 TaxID=2775301 RepID=UPI00177F285F|nr:hypothetical protein [Rhizobium sp. CFBP 8752]MBD8665625.1 hypothetical protein [Rhizobium sp. CFBP 8752]